MYWAITPSLASREAFFAAVATPFLRRRSTATSKSPLDSVSAFLQSIKPALVISRSLPTAAAFISAINFSRFKLARRRPQGRQHLRVGAEAGQSPGQESRPRPALHPLSLPSICAGHIWLRIRPAPE